MVIRLLDAVTEDGFAFRVDMRLRPYGDSGALVGALNALEVYYQEQGREWERYAMMKARPVTGDAAAQHALMNMLGAFVYRRYTDFSVIAALRDMKAMMRAEVARLGMESDLKRGAGGIREVEFIAQSLQLIHGGRRPELRCRPLLDTLTALSAKTSCPQIKLIAGGPLSFTAPCRTCAPGHARQANSDLTGIRDCQSTTSCFIRVRRLGHAGHALVRSAARGGRTLQ